MTGKWLTHLAQTDHHFYGPGPHTQLPDRLVGQVETRTQFFPIYETVE